MTLATLPALLALGCLLAVSGSVAAAPALAGARVSAKADFYVSLAGNDAWSGARPAPAKGGADGPFRTLQRAQKAVRELRAKRSGAIHVAIRSGTYYLTKPLVFTPEDSPDSASPVVYEAYGREKPVLSGGQRLSGFKVNKSGAWELFIPEVKSGKWMFSQLFVNGSRRYRPRLPEKGYYFIADKAAASEKTGGKGYDRFVFAPGDIRSTWHNIGDVEVLPFHNWTMSRFRIQDVNEATRTVTFTGQTVTTVWWQEMKQGSRYLVENVKEALNSPGEFYLDSKSGVLTYLPRKGENPATALVVAPRLETLVELRGEPAKHRWIQGLILRGLTFEHTNWTCPPGSYVTTQAEVGLGAAITAEGTRDSAFVGCRVRGTGEWGVQFGAGCKRNRLDDCELTDLGAGGVKISLTAAVDDEEQMASHNTVRNCLIAHGGRIHNAAVGVWIGHSPYNLISHNDIYDFYYTGISCGWSWGYGRSQAHHNTLEYNHIHDIGQFVLSDMGGIYTLGVAPGSVERGNVIHDVNSFAYGGWGIYFDEGSTGWVAENNLVYRCKAGNLHQHYGKENRVVNNILALAPQDGQIIRTRPEDHISFIVEHNIVYWTGAPLLGSNWTGNNYKLDYNLYWRTDGKPIEFAGMGLDEWRKRGQDVHSIIADPQFVNPAKDDFRLKPGSPASRIGFKAWDYRQAGRPGTDWSKQKISLPRAYPLPEPAPPKPVSMDSGDRAPDGEAASG